jgi:CubicO group peptidase (beta-lactamase class C family)
MGKTGLVLLLGFLSAWANEWEGCPRMADWPQASILDLMPCVEGMYFPPAGLDAWESRTPEELGWDTRLLGELFDYLELQQTRAFLVLYRGRLVLEHYWGEDFLGQTFDQNSYWYWASAGKTLTAALVGQAQYEGFLSLNDPTSAYLGDGWTSLPPEKEALIHIWHQLTMTSGLDDEVEDPYCTDPECLVFLEEAGQRWSYHNAPYTLLDRVIEQGTGQGFSSYFNQKLRNPIGMDGFWTYSGYNHVYYSTARSMARFGLLMLLGGAWEGIQVLEDTDFVYDMIHPSQELNPSYGYLWWLNGQAEMMVPYTQFVFPGPICPNAPEDMVAAMGKNGQMLNVVPSEDLVVVRMGENPDQSLVPFIFQDEFWAYLKQIIRLP